MNGRLLLAGSATAGVAALAVFLTVESTTPVDPVQGDAVVTETAQAPGGPNEGIKVHGDWVIEVRNADGTVAGRYEFNNELWPPGRIALAQLLGNTATIEWWSIRIDHSGGESPCVNPAAEAESFACLIQQPNFPVDSPNFFKNLVVELSGDGTQVILRGMATAAIDGFVNRVWTRFSLTTNMTGFFTNASLPTLVSVQAGQSIAVSVTFSFS